MRIHRPALSDIKATDEDILSAEERRWTRLSISQPVPWPEVNSFLDRLQGDCLTASRACRKDGASKFYPVKARHDADQNWRQFFWFSDENAAFAFRMRFG
jgi:hypothetical protein